MAVWPFRRKSRRKRPRGDVQSDPESTLRDTPEDLAQVRARRRNTDSAPQTLPSAPVKRQPNKLHRRERSYSFERGREDALAIERRRTSRKRRTGTLAQGPVEPRVHPHPYSKDLDPPNAALSHPEHDIFLRMPTLHHKRNAEHMAHKKLSKRRKADQAREAEIRAMSSFEPTRPTAETWLSGRPMRRDTRRVATTHGLGFRRSFDRENPGSDISLPLPDSIDSNMSSDSEQVSYKVSAFEALAPRPTLRYTVHPRQYSPPPERPNRHMSVRNRVSEKRPIPEATLKAHKRIDDLADDLTASDLRELMERDGRRRARKQAKDQERMERRLARRAEKERAAEREGRYSPPNLERGVLGRESGLGIDPESAVVTSSTPRVSPKSSQRGSPTPPSKQSGKRSAEEMDDDEEVEDHSAQGPIEHFHRTDSIPLDNRSLASVPEDPPPPRTRSPRKKIILMPRTSRSRSPPPPAEPAKTETSTLRNNSEGSIKRFRRSWSNLFRWGSRKRKTGPSSFSNTSRDSMPSHQAPPITDPIPAALSRKLSSNVPKRTLSRFREDLPELPLSPPQSRDTSPELEQIPSAITEQDSPELGTDMDIDDTIPKRRDTPMSPEDMMGRAPLSMPSSVVPSPEPVPISLGTVDSEGAWFGTKKKNAGRRSIPTPLTPPQRPVSMSTFDSHHDPDLPTEYVADDDESDFDDDASLSRFAHQRSSDSHVSHARSSSDASDDARWGVVGGQTPNVVQPGERDFIKSREGLLNTFSDDGHDSERGDVDAPLVVDEENKENELLHANNAVRHSKGSVKIMNVTPRNSVDRRRVSTNIT
ncbi:hypothetical protein N0V93_007720 [Gnomoniopsis smithogilvyi]|uniref:Uncharacterized protein n=1 Tax=Gnomoniopsis smithogilvyi TaxID=1191159 RepID=A0A9W8YLA6_9PEZI|nr:hypothetical protein N0V93_007720 [Gnomoniopsis smithogilvyi]